MDITLVPAYGRDYKSKKAIEDDFNNNMDFRNALTGQYVNKADLDNYNRGQTLLLKFRYKNLRGIHVMRYTAG